MDTLIQNPFPSYFRYAHEKARHGRKTPGNERGGKRLDLNDCAWVWQFATGPFKHS
jgi:hypothetical protein